MDVTYYVALPFVMADDGLAPGEAVECTSANAAVMRAEALSRKPGCAERSRSAETGDPATVRCGIRRSAYRPVSPAPVKCISTRSMGRAMPGCSSQNVAC